MATFKSIKDLEKYVNSKITSALEKEVNETVRKTLKENVITEVYDKYTPSHYERSGGLFQDGNIESKMENSNTLSVRSIHSENGRDIAQVIESGLGYSWSHLDGEIGARPFHEETRREIEENGLAKDSMRKGLQRQGLNVD
ncbi:hypothetical protein [Lederbergia lenta]|uniref:hypothetical protein n=1 Tax=Lederbergia lenta TaxID=1467 RepID=UPI00203D3548|nr:hypothetical protein [Lederbergia lenta]MCM3110040.1 hypothetical protein [Lederbergia lenta]